MIDFAYSGDPLERPDWDDYGLAMAATASIRGDCRRRRVGAVIMTPEHRIIISGYNGAPPGGPSCLKGECPRGLHYPVNRQYENYGNATYRVCGGCNEGWPCQKSAEPGSSYDTGPNSCIALHAEQNAIMFSRPEDRKGSTLYCTDWPCDGCYRLIKGVGIARIVTPYQAETLTQVSVPLSDRTPQTSGPMGYTMPPPEPPWPITQGKLTSLFP